MEHAITRFVLAACCASVALLRAQAPPEQLAQERAQAELEVPKLIDVLALKPSMVVADVGAGGGAITVVLARWLANGRVLATDLNPVSLDEIGNYAKREGLGNVTLVQGLAASAARIGRGTAFGVRWWRRRCARRGSSTFGRFRTGRLGSRSSFRTWRCSARELHNRR